jgi:predicted lipid-binding transport protein (Tim44 family)
MSYCPKCGNKVDETMAFCPSCGTSLKGPRPSPPAPPQTPQPNQHQEKTDKNQHGFIGYLIGGLILITLGVFAILELNGSVSSGQGLAIMLFIIGVIVIVGAIYVALTSHRHSSEPH